MINNIESLKYTKEVFGDKDRIKQVLVNLISNSLKFTPIYGEIKILINVEIVGTQTMQIDSSKSRQLDLVLEISVIDNGKGISEEGIKNLFINYNKLDENKDQNTGGTGLGLSICRQMLNQMGG